MSEIGEHLRRIEQVTNRVQTFRPNDWSDDKEFAKWVVGDLGILAEAVAELLKGANNVVDHPRN